MKSLNIDIVHAHEMKSDVITYLASWIHRVPIVTTLHGWIGNSAKQRLLIALDRRHRPRVRSGDRRVETRSANAVAENAAAPNLLLLHNAIVLERYRSTGRRGFLAELLGRPATDPVLAAIGRISPEKGT